MFPFPVKRESWAYRNIIGQTQGVQHGEWTPVLTFSTVGDLSVSYDTQYGRYTKFDRLVTVYFFIDTATFTHTTASGNLRLTGLPFVCTGSASTYFPIGTFTGEGISKTGYSSIVPFGVGQASYVQFDAYGDNTTHSNVVAADMPTAGEVILIGNLTYETDE